MNWQTLLQAYRHGDTQARNLSDKHNRSIFEQDYDRIIFSTPFRRLQDKTQVIPLPEHDFVHNRLTHSIEVSSVGRTLGKMAGSALLEKYPDLNQQQLTHHDVGAIVAAAALAHDIGNPPFGHSGEAAIAEFFLHGKGKQYQNQLSEAQWEDFIRFEGNANGFRILTQSSKPDGGGLRLSYPTLAAFTKYPKESLPILPKGRASEKKFGYFQSEKHLFKNVAEALEMMPQPLASTVHYRRHPLAFLVEAADDICYHIIDFEDGIRLGWINIEKAEEMLKPIAGDKFYEKSYRALTDQDEKVSYLRAVAINNLIQETATLFMEKEAEMCQGSFDQSLLSISKYKPFVDALKQESMAKVYQAKEVLEIEAAGFEVIGGLLALFCDAVNQACVQPETKSHRLQKVLALLPNFLQNPSAHMQTDLYTRLMQVCSYVASLTDKHAISLFRKLHGIELPR